MILGCLKPTQIEKYKENADHMMSVVSHHMFHLEPSQCRIIGLLILQRMEKSRPSLCLLPVPSTPSSQGHVGRSHLEPLCLRNEAEELYSTWSLIPDRIWVLMWDVCRDRMHFWKPSGCHANWFAQFCCSCANSKPFVVTLRQQANMLCY